MKKNGIYFCDNPQELKEYYERLYNKEMKSIKEIARLENITCHAMWHRFKRLSINLRNHSESRKLRRQKKLNLPIKIIDISKESHLIFLGSLLGDGSISKNPRAYSFYFQEGHTLKQEDYLRWKINQIKEIKFKFSRISRFDPRDNKIYKGIVVYSISAPLFEKYWKLFYPNGKKVITQKILNQLSPLSLAVWMCDDGNYDPSHFRCSLSTNKFTIQENKLIVDFLKEKFNIICKIKKVKKRKYPEIYLDVKNSDKFLRLLKPAFIKYEIPKCMWYKLGHLWEGNREKILKVQMEKKKKSRLYKQKHKKDISLKRKKEYKDFIQRGICPICRKKPLVKNYKSCQQCLDKNKEWSKKRYKKNRKKIRQQQKKSYQNNKKKILKEDKRKRDVLRNKGICYYCKKRTATQGYVSCNKCRERWKKYSKEK